MVRWSLSSEFLALILLAILMLTFYERERVVGFRRRNYWICLWLSVCSILLDAVCIYTLDAGAGVPQAVNLWLNSAYFLFNVLACSVVADYLFILTLEHVYEKHCLRRARIGIWGITLLYTGLVLWNSRSGVLFYFDQAGNYCRGPWNGAGYAVMVCEILLLVLCYFQNRSSVDRGMARVMRTMPPILVLLAAFQAYYPELLLNGTLFAIADLILFLNFQSRRVETDSLTGIGNRKCFFSELTMRLAGKQPFQVILVGLRQFSEINRRFGHRWGDQFLYEVACELEGMGEAARVFRFSSVDFAVLLPQGACLEGRAPLEALRAKMEKSWRLGEVSSTIPFSLAVLNYDGQDWTASQIVEFMEYTLRLAKEDPKGEAVFDTETQGAVARRKQVVELMRRRLEEGRFQVWYQPIYSCRAGAFRAAEALLRMQDDQGRQVSPTEFIPLAEESGLEGELNRLVLKETCRFLPRARALGLESVSINLSMQQLVDQELPGYIERCLEQFGASAEQLKLEITERVLLQNMGEARRQMEALERMGLRFHLDDFGTGYSNLSRVLEMSFERVKLDQSLLSEFPECDRADRLVRTMTQLFHEMGQEVVAEGIERQAQTDQLERYGVDWLQGYLFTRPVTEEELTELLSQSQGVGTR